MKVQKILEVQQSDKHKKLKENNKKKSGRGKQEHLSFSDILELMKHSSYRRGKGGAIKQVR
ncbi:hypothetical protein [Clostridium sp. JN-1]|uniref:hypothetical protein n=1 Tax=Clostridium sp. JN-1 TaxID=2483110 RepID=UPI000F0B3E05|nr:hypothetical protein [Clostridium sp. JN-1]